MRLALFLLAGAALSTAHLVSADDGGYNPRPNLPDASVSVDSGPDGVTIYIAVSDTSAGGSGDSSGGSSDDSGGWSCTSAAMIIGNATRDWFVREAPLHPGDAPWVVNCDNGFMSIVWLPISAQPADVRIVIVPGVDPASMAADLRDHVPVPDITVGVNPATGLVAMPSWFWIEGYDGSAIRTSDTLGDTTVEVEVRPTGYRWSFGDGEALETDSLGEAYPQESDIRHTYQQSSLADGGAFQVTVRITFSVRYRVDGGPWEPLDPITRSFSAAYRVQQLQSILTGQ
jgi:hypothetical protein